MKINSVAMLCPLLQPVSLYSLPNAPSLVDLDWEETNTQTGKTSVFQFICPVFRPVFPNIYSGFVCTVWQRRRRVRQNPILIPAAASLSWIPVVETGKCAWFIKTALQVSWLRSQMSLMVFSEQGGKLWPNLVHFLGVVAQQSEIWFLDRSLCWHFLTTSFTSYYRLMVTHLGLPEWQYSFTPYGPSPQAKVPKFIIVNITSIQINVLLRIHKI